FAGRAGEHQPREASDELGIFMAGGGRGRHDRQLSLELWGKRDLHLAARPGAAETISEDRATPENTGYTFRIILHPTDTLSCAFRATESLTSSAKTPNGALTAGYLAVIKAAGDSLPHGGI